MEQSCRDSGGVVIGWLTKLVVGLALAGVVLFDGISLTVARLGAQDDANTAASAAAASYQTSHNIQLAYNAAAQALTNSSETVLVRGFVVDPDGTVHLLMTRNIRTMLVDRIGPLKKLGHATVSGEAPPPTL
jgi:hypothetical protein